MALSVDALVNLWGTPLGPLPQVDSIDAVSSDSRADLAGVLFVPLVGERFDGHRFLADAFAGGALAALADRGRCPLPQLEALAQSSGRPIWPVDDTLAALQQLGRLWRRGLTAPVVAVTGSAGKTTTRELIRGALQPLGTVVASRANDNNDIGAPGTLLRAGPDAAAVVVEMGMRGLGEIERLSRCAEPDIAVITNIGTAHIGRLGSREAIARAKCEITVALAPGGLVVIPAGDPLLEASLAAAWTGRTVRVALAEDAAAGPPADLLGRLSSDGVELRLEGDHPFAAAAAGQSFRLPLEGRHNARNLLLALAVAQELGVAPEPLRQLRVELPGGRSRSLRSGGLEILDETYNASPEAVLAALDLLAGRPALGRRYAVLGTMLELGERSLELHRLVAARALERGLDGLVIVAAAAEGEAMLEGAAGLPRLLRVETPEQAAEPLRGWLAPGDVVLLKASRGVALERLIPLLTDS
ncbi:MAG: UDP-N-acetylmuramoyl-tripeptide--D-alanyl-D-alanine ligase [Synechococcaceae cyanobacterium]|nr:UDP-N-acetylmuramoyl-tripeptide--D-alanyl-D-alanine ligase [Synechococcaceae cyanobacterium]